MLNADGAWNRLIRFIYDEGETVYPRGKETREVLGYQTVIDMQFPIVTNPVRKLGYKFQAAEAAWILSGNEDVASIKPFSRSIENFSDDGVTFFGAYGPKISAQLHYVRDCLIIDNDSRQAVINIWRENPPKTKDVPCTTTVQFLIRDGKLHCVDTMRSSDAWLGWPYDVFNFSMLSAALILMLRDYYPGLELGSLTLTAGSQHLYATDFPGVVRVITEPVKRQPYQGLDRLQERFHSANQLLCGLWDAARGDGALAWAQRDWVR